MRALALALALLCVPLAFPATQASVAILRPIVGDQTYADGEFVFSDYLLVPPGSTLTFRNATVWMDAARLCTGRTNLPTYRCQPQLDIRGTLVVENSTIDTHVWDGLGDTGYIVHAERGTLVIRGSTLRHFLQVGVQQAALAPSLIEDSAFVQGVGPLRFMQGADATFRRNLVEDVREGVLVTDAAVAIEDNRFHNVIHGYGGTAFNWAIAVTGSSPSDHAWASRTRIAGNVVENATVGIVTQTGVANVVEDNVLRNTRAGMLVGIVQDGQLLDRVPPVVRRNLIQNATEGIRISAAAATGPAPQTTETLSLADNVLVDIQCYPLRVLPMTNAIQLHVDATGIWWGSGSGPPEPAPGCATVRIDDDLATVDATTWLRAPPRWVAPHLPGIMGP